MSLNSSNFSTHYIKLRIEGNNPEIFLNQCIKTGLRLNDVEWKSDTELVLWISKAEYAVINKLAGNRYKIRVIGNKGVWYRLKSVLSYRSFIMGLIVFTALIVYQSFFITEIKVSGYESISEQSLRKTLKEAGLYEGCRKDVDLNNVKLQIYDEYDRISWVGIEYEGNLAHVTVAEGAKVYNTRAVEEGSPCNIVAEKDGYIDSVVPREGMRAVQDGAYVKAGDILITGVIPLEGTNYASDGAEETEMYVHAKGTVKARIPVHMTFFCDTAETVRVSSGPEIWSISLNGFDFVRGLIPYETASVKYTDIVNIASPFRLKIQLVRTQKTELKQNKLSKNYIEELLLNNIHKYVKENLPEDTEILNKSLNFVQEKNIIRIGVTLETLQQIGIEEEIIIDNSNGKSEKNDGQ